MLAPLPPEIAVLRFGVFALDLRRHEFRRDGRPVHLANLPFEGLRLLATHPQVTLTRADLIAALWPGELADRNESLDTLMRQVRTALGDSHLNPRFLQTVRGVGFCFLADVTHVAIEAPAPPEPVSIGSPQPAAVASPPPARQRSWARAGLAAAAAALVLAAGVVWLSATHAVAPLQIRGDWVELTHDGLQKKGRIFVRGGWIYFSEVRDGRYRVVRVATDGGTVEPVPSAPPDAMLLAISPQGDRLVLQSPVSGSLESSDAPLWMFNKDGLHRLGDFSAHAAAWSPDGQTLLFAHGDALFLAGPAGLHPRHLLDLSAEATALTWSPDSSQVRFVGIGAPDGKPTEWEMRRDGSHLHPLGSVGLAKSSVDEAWRPDGRGSLLLATSECVDTRAWEFPPRGPWEWHASSPSNLELGLVSKSAQVAFDAPMRRLYRMGFADEGNLVRYASARDQFPPVTPRLSMDYLDYSPRGDAVTYTAAPDGPVWRAQTDFSHRQRLTPPGLRTELPRWSPDGRWIAFMAQTDGQPWNLDMVAASGGPVQVLAQGTPTGSMGAPTWSPDGERLYFGRVICPDPATCGIERLDLRGRTLTILPGSEGLRTARVSPDGRYVAALNPAHEMEVCDLRAGVWRQLAAVGTEDTLAWSHDSQYVYAFEPPGSPPRIFRIRLRDGAAQPVVNLAPLGPPDDIVGYWFGLDPQDRPIVFRSARSDEIFAANLGKP